MGKMKEVFMSMKEDEWFESEEKYLEYYVEINGLGVDKDTLREEIDTNEKQNVETI